MMKQFFQRIRDKARDVSQAPVLIVAYGDSVTQGAMQPHVLDAEGVYHRLLEKELAGFFPSTTFSTINAGVSGASAAQALERLERDVLRHDPDLVLIAFGLNDSLGGLEGLAKFEDALREMITRIRLETSAAVILLTPPFMARRDNARIHPDNITFKECIIRAQTDGTLARYAQAIREIASAMGTGLADIHQEWERLAGGGLDTDVWLANGLNHPDRQGHQLGCRVIFNAIFNDQARNIAV